MTTYHQVLSVYGPASLNKYKSPKRIQQYQINPGEGKDLMNGGPILITEHATGKEEYSDGEVEEDILSFVSSGRDLEEVVRNDRRWAVLYHLDQRRRNLLEWYPFARDASLLEIGAGCGALTGLFTEKLRSVTAIELSPRRAKIIATRYRSKENLILYAGRFEDVQGLERYDYVTLIGVLEYAGRYQRSSSPYLDMLKHVLSLLKTDGTMVLAIENRLGMKYWAGAPEDHSGKLFHGLEGYRGEDGFRTFGREELIALLNEAGFHHLNFYYPHPDYKIPERIYSDRSLPAVGELCGMSPNYDQERFALFDEGLAYDSLLTNKAFPLMANSFLVLCRR
jgi:2-polyprenyl-3-methyl-5-hydroxy-6-metoxy-1,4-benzoquinol methylase